MMSVSRCINGKLTNVIVSTSFLSLSLLTPSPHLCLLLCSLCRLAALHKRQSGQRAGNCFHICDNHQHLHRSVATSAIAPQQQQEAIAFGIISCLPHRSPAPQDAAPCTAASAISVHLVDTNSNSNSHFNLQPTPTSTSTATPTATLCLVLVLQWCSMQLTMPTCLAECNNNSDAPRRHLWLTHLAEDDWA